MSNEGFAGAIGTDRSVTSQPGMMVELLEDRRLLAADAALEWNAVLLDAVRAERTPPPYAARNMAIVQTAVLDAVTAVGKAMSRAAGRAAEAAAVARAAHDTLVALYPARRATFDAALGSTLEGVPDGAAERDGIAAGRKAARQVLKAREDDGADAAVPYTPGTGHDDWRPTPPAFAAALLPGWGDVTPFALDKGRQFRPPKPPPITSKAFAQAFARVKSLGAGTGGTRTAEQTEIALFWADGAGTVSPPGHWNRIAAGIGEDRGNTLRENARMLAVLNVALADAGIACWDAKYTFDFCRPVTAIRNAAADGNAATEADAGWSPLIATPPFPSYVSGHSTFSAAAAAALAGFFGTDRVAFSTTSDGLQGVTRTFKSLSAAAEEAGISRVYGGIHWDFDNTAGLALGRAVGRYVAGEFLDPRDRHDSPHGFALDDGTRPAGSHHAADGSSASRHVWDDNEAMFDVG